MNAVVKHEQAAIAVSADAGALMKVIEKASLDPNFDVAKLKELLAVKERWDANEARKAFTTAFSAFKAQAVKIIKNKSVSDGPLKGKRYAELYAVVDAVTPALSEHGFSHSWKVKDEKDWIEVTCTLTHVLGHSESVSMGGPADTGGAKNAIQARASTVTYLQRYTLKAVTGLAEHGDDTDGNLPGGQMKEGELADHFTAIDSASTEKEVKVAFAAGWKRAEEMNDMRAMKKLGDRKEARLKALGIK